MNNLTTIQLTDDEAKLFVEFQRNYQMIAHTLGVMRSLNLTNLNTCELTMHYDQTGSITHAQITKHFNKLSTVASPVVVVV